MEDSVLNFRTTINTFEMYFCCCPDEEQYVFKVIIQWSDTFIHTLQSIAALCEGHVKRMVKQ